ncbi:MAG: sodium:solute symporter [Lewinella sp.]|nr:sodium:solute symporter [Lewinella sp.]
MEEFTHYGFWSLIPPLVAIALAILTKQVFISLLLGIFLGWTMINGWNPLLGLFDTLQALVDVFADAGNTRTIMFCALVGALIIFMQRSGGVAGFINLVTRRLHRYEGRHDHHSRLIVGLLAWLTGALIFVESSISVLTVGSLYRPLFDRLGISREKLAYVADSSSAPSSILIPFNGWGAFIMGLLAAQGFSDPFATMIRSIGWNFYPLLALFMVPAVLIWGKDIGPMRKAEARTRDGHLLWEGAQPMIADELTDVEIVEGAAPKAYNMVVPIAVMVFLMPVMLAYTGWADAAADKPTGWWDHLFLAIGKGSGSTAVLTAVVGSILVSMAFYKYQKLMGFREMVDLTLKGISGMIPLSLLMLLAFAIGALCKQELGTGQYVAEVTQAWLSPNLAPFLIFLVSCFVAFSIGSSWGTFAIMIPIGVGMGQVLGANEYMVIAAALGGGVFGDHCSPISDTTILSSMASATDHVDHVKTQLPYALIAGGLAALLYLVFGMVM